MQVRIPSVLFSYTGDRAEVEASGATLGELLRDLDRRYPGFYFRVVDEQDRLRAHIQCFVSGAVARDLARPLAPDDRVMLVAALSGG